MKRMIMYLCAIVAMTSALYASVPGLIQYQGRLTDAAGSPLNGTHTLTFVIFDSPDQGLQKWSETHENVMVTEGLFTVILGSLSPLADSVFNGAERYVQITVDGETVLPRTQLTSVGYAQRVGTVAGAAGGTITDSLVIIPSAQQVNRLPAGVNTIDSKIYFGFSTNSYPTMSFYEPVDSKVAGTAGASKQMEISSNSIIMFGENDDTVLIVHPNGDITSKGQITMGENSSPGYKTTVLGFQNTAAGDSSTIGGGSGNTTTGVISVVAGGHANRADGEGSVVGGGAHNTAAGRYATVSGGQFNTALGDWGIVPGGENNDAGGLFSYAAGRRAKAAHDGSFVWADHTDADFSSTADDQFLIRAGGGVGIGTNAPQGLFDVVGPAGNGSVNLPDSSIAAPEILDEPGVVANWNTADVALTQHATTMEPLVTVTITLPAPGYVQVRGQGTLEIYGTSQRNQAYMQVSESPSSGSLGPFSRLSGTGDNDAQSRRHYFDMSAERMFYAPAGSHTYVLEGLAHPMNGSGAVTNIQHPQLTAVYLPTSYGPVVGFVAVQGANGGSSPNLVNWVDPVDSISGVVTQQYYKVNLQDLEANVTKAKALLDKAEADLKAAQTQQSSNR